MSIASQPDRSDQATCTPDLPCLKCGSGDVVIRYMAEAGGGRCLAVVGPMRNCRWWGGKVEHFHRSCRRCGYEWSTNDVLANGGGS